MTASPSRARILRPIVLTALLASGALLSACGQKQEAAPEARSPEARSGETVVISNDTVVNTADEGQSLELSAKLPALAPAYPGARVTTQITDQQSDQSGKGSVVIFSTPDPVEKVAAFYDAKARELGVKADMIVNEKDSAVRIFGSGGKGGKSEGALIAISKSDEGPGTEIVITAGAADKEVRAWEKQDWKSAPRPMPRLQ